MDKRIGLYLLSFVFLGTLFFLKDSSEKPDQLAAELIVEPADSNFPEPKREQARSIQEIENNYSAGPSLQRLSEDSTSPGELYSWEKEKTSAGIFSDSDYANYDEVTLAKLAEENDVSAMQVLAMRYFTTDRNKENLLKAKKLMHDAAVQGAQEHPFRVMASEARFQLELALEGEIEMSAEAFRETLVEALSYSHLGALRGSPELTYAMHKDFLDRHDIHLSEDERSDIESRAHRMYRELQVKRDSLGLGPFDNTVPFGVRNHLDQPEATLIEQQ